MKRVSLDKAHEAWDSFAADAKDRIFKCEVLQDYSAIDQGPSLRAWQSGEKEKSLDYARKDFQAWIKKMKALPVKVTRVHVVETPLTPYLEWEIAAYTVLIEAKAEKVLLAHKDRLPQLEIPDGDFWIFDDKRVVKFNYQGSKGKVIDGFIYDENDDISSFLKLREELLKIAEPV